ncbi:thyrotropin receptor-like protein [Labeo rohita]|uniref:Thyrotropin receptor-like protein n=1 Tax=Labeo rohita TaxID=84645 RepID=A0A498MUJ8_LABRO|nr:thyrotropin receptor-like protein [Labeo rohita]RXN20345.1 thyrotropin receptor-like protein [Labeo rohita]
MQRGGVPVPLPRSSVPPGKRWEGATSGGELAGLMVTVRNSPKRKLPPFTSTSQPVERPKEQTEPSHEVPLVSFGAPPDDRTSTAASEGEPDLSGEDDLSTLVPTRWSAVPDMDPEMMAMLAWVAKSVGLEWKPPSHPEPSLLDDWYLGVARAGSKGPTFVWPRTSRYVQRRSGSSWPYSTKRAVSSISGSPEGMGVVERANLGPRSTSPLASGQQWPFGECYQTYYCPKAEVAVP